MSLNGALRSLNAARSHGLRVHLRRLLVAPAIEGATASNEDGLRTYRLSGVVCGVCATRTEDALRFVPGVEVATVDLDASRATLRLAPGATVDAPALQRALEGVVVGMGMRRRIERATRRLMSNLVRS